MKITRWDFLGAFVGVCLSSATAVAGSRNDCFYNGAKADDPPKDFTGEYTCKDSDTGKVVRREHRLNGEPDGDYTKFDFKTGEIEETGHYRAGKLDGTLRRFHAGGVVYIEQNYVAGKRQGVQRDFRDGKLSRVYLVNPDGSADTSYQLNKQGQLTSLTCKTRAISEKDAAWCAFNGKQSTVSFYDEQGRVRATEQYVGGKQHGAAKRFNVATGAVTDESQWENGKKLKAGEQHFDKQGAPLAKTDCDEKRTTCTETIYFEGGKQVRSVTVKAGLHTVKRTEYYQNGKPQEERVALPGADPKKLETPYTVTTYYDNGQVERKGKYLAVPGYYDDVDYLPEGLIETYHEDGTPAARETYLHGRLQGRSERFGTRQGKKLREEAEYDKNAVVRHKIFIDGKLSEESEFFPDGSTKSHKTYPLDQPATKI